MKEGTDYKLIKTKDEDGNVIKVEVEMPKKAEKKPAKNNLTK